MKPILYEANTTMYTGTGLGMLSDCISCEVTEERNGIFECEFEYPITGIHYAEIVQGRIIRVSHDEEKDLQPFTIYERSAEINGIVTLYAHHISYDLNQIIVSPYNAINIETALAGLRYYAMVANPFVFWTDKTSAGTFSVKVPSSVRSLLGGSEGSILDAFGGGEYKFDGRTVKLYQNRGADNGVTIRYGKNLTDISQSIDASSLYNSVVPYWTDGTNTVVYGGVVTGEGGIRQTMTWTDESGLPMQDEGGNVFTFSTALSKVVPMDLSGYFESAPSVSQLESRALSILNNNEPWIPKENIEIDFVALWQTEEYKSIAPLERVKLCDTVHVRYEDLGVDATAKVIRVVWDALTERYTKIELGDAKTSFADVLMAETDKKVDALPSYSEMDLAIQNATNLITGGMGGHIVFLYDADGKPTDMLVMDTEDTSTAVHVLRINVNGIGFSSNGVNGPYTSAWTLDGAFVADFITAGSMSAARIHGGTLELGGLNNGNGSVVVYDADGNIIGMWDNSGIEINGGIIRTTDGARASSIESGYTKYYTGDLTTNSIIGSIGTRSYQSQGSYGLEMDIAYDADGIGWYASQNAQNTNYDPVLVYVRDGGIMSSGGVVSDDSVYANRDFIITSGHSLYGSAVDNCEITNTSLTDCDIVDSTFDGTVVDPAWNLNNTLYAGVTKTTGTFALVNYNQSTARVDGYYAGCSMTFIHGILVDCVLP